MNNQEIEEICDKAIDYYEGIEVERDTKKAIELLMPISEISVKAQFCLGNIYWNKECKECDNEKAVYWYSRAGENGHPFAQLWLGHNYCIGLKSEVDLEKSIYWYKKASEQNVALAQYQLGSCYSTGWGVEKDLNKALEYMQKAAKNNFFDADLYLLELYKKNRDTDAKLEYEKQLKTIEDKYNKRLRKDELLTLKYANNLMIGNGFDTNYELAFDLLNSDCLKNNVKAKELLARCYEKGKGTKINIDKAKEIYSSIADVSKLANKRLKILNGEV